MTAERVIFYHKPGCINNEKQKRILKSAQLNLDERNLLTENWDAETLKPFFGAYLISECFNNSAPAIKSGEIDPANLSFDEALALMVKHPILIRRPLLIVNGQHILGFNAKEIEIYSGHSLTAIPDGIEQCAVQGR